MAANLTSVVTQFLTPEVVAQISSFLGLDRAATQKVTAGAVPALLAGLSDLVTKPAGASQLSKLLLSSPQAGAFTDLLRKGDLQGLSQTGSGMLSGLFGGRTVDAMSQAIGKFAGIGDTGGKSLLSLLGPIVIGALGQQQRDAGLDANGLASLLRSQKDQIVAAIPSGLADQLGSAGLIDKAEAGMRSGMAAASAAGSRITSASERAGAGASQAGYAAVNRMGQWPYWLAALVLVAGLGWYAIGHQSQPTIAEQPAPMRPATTQTNAATQPETGTVTGTVGKAVADLTVDGVNLANQFNSSLNSLKSTLSGITDLAGAQAALPKINEMTAQLNDIKTRAAKLSPEGRSDLAKLIAAATPVIDQMCSKVMAIPGVGAVAKPAIDDLRAGLDALARA
jgi:hypothetical protein